ncbi:MAG: ABC transporter substrate-binding protein [Faecalibacterium sp.]
MRRREFLCLAPCGAAALVLSGCSPSAAKGSASLALEVEQRMPLEFAQQFSLDVCSGGYTLVTIADRQLLVVPEGAPLPGSLPAEITVVRQPVKNIYLVSTSAMDLICALGALDCVALSGTRTDGWYVEKARQAMEDGRIAYAGKYSAPDYERILSTGCGLAVENTMIYHTPEVLEQLERFGIPVLLERSSYESSPLARMEWIKLYGILLDRQEQAEQIFAQALVQLEPVLDQPSTGCTAAFFAISTSHLATVRKGSDYIARCIELAGGSYVFSGLADDSNSLGTMNLPLETFCAGAKGADVLLYNGTILGEITSKAQLIEKCPLLADFPAVQQGRIWCVSPSLFQQTMGLGDFIADLNAVFRQALPEESSLHYLSHIQD